MHGTNRGAPGGWHTVPGSADVCRLVPGWHDMPPGEGLRHTWASCAIGGLCAPHVGRWSWHARARLWVAWANSLARVLRTVNV